jgi:hypothetical protein
MILSMKKSLIDRTNYIKVSTTLILRCLEKKILQNHFKYFQVLEIYLANCRKWEGPIQLLARTFKKMI